MSGEIPDLYARIIEKQPFLGKSKAGVVPGYIRNGEFLVKSKRMSDGSLVQSTKTAKKSLETMLQRQGCSEAQI